MPRSPEILPETNVVLRYLLRDDAEQYSKAAAFFENVRIGKKRIVIIESVLVECVYILLKFYKTPKDEVADVLITLLQYKGIANTDRQTLIEALRTFAARKLDIVDCMLLARAQRGRGEIFSFDKALNRLHQKKAHEEETPSGDS